jgi:hypothetical protein
MNIHNYILTSKVKGKEPGCEMAGWKSTNYATRNKIRQNKPNVTTLTCPAKQDYSLLNFTQKNAN